jgi:hypothetical protein
MGCEDDLTDIETTAEECVRGAVTLQRGDVSTPLSSAQWSDRDCEVCDDDGTITTVDARDYLIAAADYKVGAAEVSPRQGDVLIDADSQQWQVQEHERHGDYRLIRTRRIA